MTNLALDSSRWSPVAAELRHYILLFPKHGKEMEEISPIKLYGREIKPHKAIVGPLFSSRTVLTSSPWDFVEL
jgi:hypothetical protein